jgi:3-oxocholest-4-en-26-oate---CoA ligase
VAGWNFADIWEACAEKVPEAPCQIQGDRIVSWAEFNRRANGLAADLLASGLGQQAKVAVYLYNCPEYLESYFACFKVSMVPVNVNYRYGPDEIAYLLDDADAEAVVFDGELEPIVDKVRERLPKVRRWYVVSDDDPEPEWATPYEGVVQSGGARVVAPWGRSGDDLLFLYTGGTTGMPKGVMWRQDDLFNVLGGGGNAMLGLPAAESIEELMARLPGPGPRALAACPLMHGTGQLMALVALDAAGSIVTLVGHHLDPVELWRTVSEQSINLIFIVGDAFARPMAEELEKNRDAYDLSSLVVIVSSGVMWSREVKERLHKCQPTMLLFDSFGSSEAVGLGTSTSMPGAEVETAQFRLGERVHVLTDDGRPVEPGSDEVGLVALSGFLPVGYYKDDEKTAKTFRTIDGIRYSVPGDYATVNPDGTLALLGRGSGCINTGGEKVFPEEVEEVLKLHPSVRDAVCVGVPDERFGQAVAALVEPEEAGAVNEQEIIAYVKEHLASFKAPRHVITVDSIARSPAGKVDYPGLRDLARRRLEV